jgi:hypothetical protein
MKREEINMTDAEAIAVLEVLKAEIGWNKPLDYGFALDIAIDALRDKTGREESDHGEEYMQ